jgi:hypothetical protein
MEGGMKLTADDLAYLQQAAMRDHYNPADAQKVFAYESSNRPDVWGGKGGKYFGIFQAGPSERAQFGIDTKNPSARNQIDAFGKFLAARGYKPGMGLLDMYSTVNAGSPGHYKASDGNGTVASHVAAMMGQKPAVPSSAPNMSSASPFSGNIAYAPAEQAAPTSIEDIIEQQPKPQTSIPAGLLGLRQAALADEQKQTDYDEEMRRQMKALHDQIHQASIAGLLSGGM